MRIAVAPSCKTKAINLDEIHKKKKQQLTTREREDGSHFLECKRTATQVIELKERIEDCFDFVARCKKMIKCAKKTNACENRIFGNETNFGFVTDIDPRDPSYRWDKTNLC